MGESQGPWTQLLVTVITVAGVAVIAWMEAPPWQREAMRRGRRPRGRPGARAPARRGGPPGLCRWGQRLARPHEPAGRIKCALVTAAGGEYGRHMIMAFCSRRHMEYWVHSSGQRAQELAARNQGRIYGQLPAGSKRMIG